MNDEQSVIIIKIYIKNSKSLCWSILVSVAGVPCALIFVFV